MSSTTDYVKCHLCPHLVGLVTSCFAFSSLVEGHLEKELFGVIHSGLGGWRECFLLSSCFVCSLVFRVVSFFSFSS